MDVQDTKQLLAGLHHSPSSILNTITEWYTVKKAEMNKAVSRLGDINIYKFGRLSVAIKDQTIVLAAVDNDSNFYAYFNPDYFSIKS